LADIPAGSCRISGGDDEIGNVSSYDRTRTHYGILANANTAEYGGIRSDAGTFIDGRRQDFSKNLAPRNPVVCEYRVGTHKNPMPKAHSIPEIHAIFDNNLVADDHFPFNVAMLTYIASATDFCAAHHVGKGPNARAFSHPLGVHQS
jgi:hypothetical protein